MISDEEINKLTKEKYEYIKQFDKKEITEEQCQVKVKEIDRQISDKNILLMSRKLDETEEIIAEILHNIWIEWSKELTETESLSDERIKKWSGLWIPYAKLSEGTKGEDRVFAKRVINLDRTVKEGLFVEYKEYKKKEEKPKEGKRIYTRKKAHNIRVKPYAKRGTYKKRKRK
jgi:hypothetical protein